MSKNKNKNMFTSLSMDGFQNYSYDPDKRRKAGKKKKYKVVPCERSNSVAIVSKSLTKNGKIKGRNKAETKMLEAACCHHVPKKNGKLKSTYIIHGDMCICKKCKASFPARLLEKDDINEVYNGAAELIDQAKYLVVACNSGAPALDLLAETKIKLNQSKKIHKRVTKIARKSQGIKKNKNKYPGAETTLGFWGTR